MIKWNGSKQGTKGGLADNHLARRSMMTKFNFPRRYALLRVCTLAVAPVPDECSRDHSLGDYFIDNLMMVKAPTCTDFPTAGQQGNKFDVRTPVQTGSNPVPRNTHDRKSHLSTPPPSPKKVTFVRFISPSPLPWLHVFDFKESAWKCRAKRTELKTYQALPRLARTCECETN